MKFLKYLRRKILIGCEKASSGCGFVRVVAQTILFSQYNVFLLGVNYFFNEFQDNYKRSNSYQTSGVDNFNYNRIELLHIFDIEYKY